MPKTEELQLLAKWTNAVIAISKSKQEETVLKPEIWINSYKVTRCDRNRHQEGVACYIRNDLNYLKKEIYIFGGFNIFLQPYDFILVSIAMGWLPMERMIATFLILK